MWWLILGEQTSVADGMERLTQEMAALAGFTEELDRRLTAAGLEGTDGALDLRRRMQRILDAIPLADLEQALRDVQELVERLGALERTVAVLRELKTQLGAP